MLVRRKAQGGSEVGSRAAPLKDPGIDRRTFLQKSGVTAGALGLVGRLELGSVRAADTGRSNADAIQVRKNVCTHCSVGCSVLAEVQNGVWTRQEPVWDSPINLTAS